MDTGYVVVFFLFGMVINGMIGMAISRRVGRSDGDGFILGLLLGPIGWLLVGLGGSNVPVPVSIHVAPAATSSDHSKGSTKERLARLDDLFASKAISQEEYNAKRTQILDEV